MLRRSHSGYKRAQYALVLAGAVLTASPARAAITSGPPEPGAATAWRVVVSPFADLWYHGLAVVGFHGFGPHPLYDVAYGRTAAKARPQGALTMEAEALRAEFEGDPAFELLHFIPVYLADLSPEQALAGLRRMSDSRAGGGLEALTGAQGLAVVASLLPEPKQRSTLLRFVTALEREWARGLESELRASREARSARLGALEARWTSRFVPALAPYLEAFGLQGGWIMPSPPLGLEGRFFQGDPRQVQDNVVIVGLPPTVEGHDGTLAPVVRELCYPAVRKAFEAVQQRYQDRIAASRASDAAATRCGELLLEKLLPEALSAYRIRFGLQGPHSSAWSPLPDPDEGTAWDAALVRVLNLSGGS
jgi:hypothetical protein